jgi:hypothetical protein
VSVAEILRSTLTSRLIRERLETLQKVWEAAATPEYLVPAGVERPIVRFDREDFELRLEPVPDGCIRYRLLGRLVDTPEGTQVILSVRPSWTALIGHFSLIAFAVAIGLWSKDWFNAVWGGFIAVGAVLASFTWSRFYADALRMVVRDAAGLDPRITFLESLGR